jgi:hypothetical protein
MAKISGTYTIRISDQDASDGVVGGAVLIVRVKTDTAEEAATVAESLGRELEKLGLSIPEPPA